jgi:hypothetical protein
MFVIIIFLNISYRFQLKTRVGLTTLDLYLTLKDMSVFQTNLRKFSDLTYTSILSTALALNGINLGTRYVSFIISTYIHSRKALL